MHSRRFAATAIACVVAVMSALPAQSAEVRMSVSAVVLSHCSMQLMRANVNPVGGAPFNARCNTSDAPRVHAASQLLSSTDATSAPDAATSSRTQSEIISTTDGNQRIAQYIQYTIEY